MDAAARSLTPLTSDGPSLGGSATPSADATKRKAQVSPAGSPDLPLSAFKKPKLADETAEGAAGMSEDQQPTQAPMPSGATNMGGAASGEPSPHFPTSSDRHLPVPETAEREAAAAAPTIPPKPTTDGAQRRAPSPAPLPVTPLEPTRPAASGNNSGDGKASSRGWTMDTPAEDRVQEDTAQKKKRVKNRISNRELQAMYEDLQRMGPVSAGGRRPRRGAQTPVEGGGGEEGKAGEGGEGRGRRDGGAKGALRDDLEALRRKILEEAKAEEEGGGRRTRRGMAGAGREGKHHFMQRGVKGPRRPKVGDRYQSVEVEFRGPRPEGVAMTDWESKWVSRCVYDPAAPPPGRDSATPAKGTPGPRGRAVAPLVLTEDSRMKIESRVMASLEADAALSKAVSQHLGSKGAHAMGVYKGIGRSVMAKWSQDEMDQFALGYKEFSDDLAELRAAVLPNRSQADVVEFYWVVWLPGLHPHVRKLRGIKKNELRKNVEVDDDSDVSEDEEAAAEAEVAAGGGQGGEPAMEGEAAPVQVTGGEEGDRRQTEDSRGGEEAKGGGGEAGADGKIGGETEGGVSTPEEAAEAVTGVAAAATAEGTEARVEGESKEAADAVAGESALHADGAAFARGGDDGEGRALPA